MARSAATSTIRCWSRSMASRGRSRSVTTRSDLGVGDVENKVLAILGEDAVERIPQDESYPSYGNFLSVWSADHQTAVRFAVYEGALRRHSHYLPRHMAFQPRSRLKQTEFLGHRLCCAVV